MSAAGTPETRALVRRIQDVRFTTGRVRVSYDMNDVDQLLDRLVDLVEAGEDPRPSAVGAEFRTVRWTEGYTMKEVDAFLDALLLDPALVPAGPATGPITLPMTSVGNATTASSSAPKAATGGSRVGPRPAQEKAPAPVVAAAGSTRRGGRTVGGMLLDHLEAIGAPMPEGATGALVTEGAERLAQEATRYPNDVLDIAVAVADVVLAAAAVAEHYGFTVEEAVREKTLLEQRRTTR